MSNLELGLSIMLKDMLLVIDYVTLFDKTIWSNEYNLDERN